MGRHDSDEDTVETAVKEIHTPRRVSMPENMTLVGWNGT
jgi:hypothetical protein